MQDPLRGINSVVPGEEIGDGDGHQVEGGAAEAEHLTADEERCDGAVRHAAENAGHADGREECWISADEQGKGVTEGGADEEGGHDLAALEAAGQGHRREEDLQQEGRGADLKGRIVDAGINDGGTGAVIGLTAHEGR